jgi:hypothetical protein
MVFIIVLDDNIINQAIQIISTVVVSRQESRATHTTVDRKNEAFLQAGTAPLNVLTELTALQ